MSSIRAIKKLGGAKDKPTKIDPAHPFDRNIPACPVIVNEICACIEQNGMYSEGILRISGTFKEIAIIKEKYFQGQTGIDLAKYSIHSVAGVLSSYFTELANPLFTFEMYDLWMATMSLQPHKLLVECLRHVVYLLPPGNRAILARILETFSQIAANHTMNKMSVHNIAIAMTPSLIRPEIETIETLVAYGQISQELVVLLIDEHRELFSSPPDIELPERIPEQYAEIFEEAKDFLHFTATSAVEFGQDNAEVPAPVIEEFPEIPPEERPIVLIQALWRGRVVRKFLEDVNMRYQIGYNRGVWELMKRESNFVWAVKKDINVFETNLGATHQKLSKMAEKSSDEWQLKLVEVEIKTIVANLRAVIEVHSMILEELTNVWTCTWPLVRRVGEVLISKMPLLIVYNAYVDMYCRIQRQLAEDKSAALGMWMKRGISNESKTRGQSRTLEELLALPFKHIFGWQNPLQKLVRAAVVHKEDVLDLKNIVKVFAIISRLAIFVDTLQEWNAHEQLKSIERSVEGIPAQLSAAENLHRTYNREGALTVASENRHVFLFNDGLLVTKARKKKFKFCYFIDIYGCTGVEDNIKNGFRLTSSQQTYQITCKTAEDKVLWFLAVQSCTVSAQQGTFGIPIQSILRRQPAEEAVPYILKTLVNYLGSLNCLTGELLCVNGDPYAVSTLRLNIERKSIEKIELVEYEPLTIIGAIKLWLIKLPEPLIRLEHLESFNLFKDRTNTVVDLVGFREMTSKLPDGHYATLRGIIRFLHTSDLDRLLIGMTWGHCIVRPLRQNIDTSLRVLLGAQVVSALVSNYHRIFAATLTDAPETAPRQARQKRDRTVSTSSVASIKPRPHQLAGLSQSSVDI